MDSKKMSLKQVENLKRMDLKLKIFIAGICILALVWLCVNSYLNFDKYDPSIKQFLSNPDKYEGKIASHKGNVVYEKEGVKGVKDGSIAEEDMYLKSGSEMILIKYKEKIPNAIFGYTLLKGAYKKSESNEQKNYIEVSEYWNNDYNYVKYIISFIALIYVIFVFFREWKLTANGFIEKIKLE
ncbi:hypothetical protein J4434_06055 [Candidatus Woesearchaeota archaeon]|nr:hypothetical protein [Candidatus Woesearchaeota archaeon]